MTKQLLEIIKQYETETVYPIDKDGFKSMRIFGKTENPSDVIYTLNDDGDGARLVKEWKNNNEFSWIVLPVEQLKHLQSGKNLIVDEDVVRIVQ